MMINAVIVDDEAPSRINLRYALAAHALWRVVAECASAAAARTALAAQAVDVIFLDIQMPQESGLALARSLSELAEPPLIIFVTAYSEHAVAAFEVHALDYLLKPLDDARLAQAVERAAAMLALAQRGAYARALRGYLAPAASPWLTHISVRSVGRIERIAVAEILWLESAGNYVQLHTAGRTILHRVTLSKLEAHLDTAHFSRVHRCAVVRLSQLHSLAVTGDGTYAATLHCGAQVPVSERYLDTVRRAME
ncbi:MAG: hypothetical protein RLZZ237_520 [Pseudomonadota bacterium]|jgi:two-component system LytT family response regulator